MKKNIYYLCMILFFLLVFKGNAQQKIGKNLTVINPDAVLELESTNKGFLLPRVALTSSTAVAPLTAHVAGMTVFNTATAGDVTPGYYYNDGSKWIKLSTGATDATTTANGIVRLAGDLSGTAAAPSVANLAINTDKLADNAVTSAKIVDGTVATADLADGAITAAKLNAMSATSGQVLKYNGTVWAPAADAGLTATTVSNAITAGALTTTVNGVAATAVTLPVADGSETKINAGTNVTVTGAGTTLSPYVVNSAIETATQTPSDAILASGSQVAVTSTNVQGAIDDLATAVKTAGNNLYTFDGTLSGNRIVTQGTNTLGFTSTATTGTSHFNVDGSTFSVNAVNNRIGIGTTTPASALNVVASGQNNGDGIYLGMQGYPNIGYAQLRVVNNTTAEPVWPGGGVMELRASNNDPGAKIVAQGNSYVNNGGGSFGIGTTFPSERLTVNGGALISSLSGTGSRMVVASATGVLSTQAVPAGATDATTTANGIVRLAGDLSGTAAAPAVANLAINTAKLADNAVTSAKIVDGTIATADLADGAITAAKLNAMSATSGQVLKYNGTVWAPAADAGLTATTVSNAITAGALTTTVNGVAATAVTLPVASDATTTANGIVRLAGDLSGTAAAPAVANLAINTAKLADNAVTSAKIVDGTVATADLADGAITAAKLNAMSATSGQVLKYNGTVWAPAADAGLTATTVSNAITAGALTTTVNGVAATAVTLPVADGSETKINAGTNVTVTGAGTTLSPYVVNSAIETATQTPSDAILASGSQVAVTSTNVQGAIDDLATAVKTAGNNLYASNGSLSGNRTVTQGTNTLGFTSSATTGTSHFNVDGSTFSVDAVNNRIGIGTTTPASALNVVASGQNNGDGIYLGMQGYPNIGYAQLRVVYGSAAEPAWPGGGVMELRAADNNPGAKIVARGNSYVNLGGGNFGIGTSTPGSKLAVVGLPVYADNAAATTGGLAAGDFYRTSTGIVMVRF